MPLYNPAPTYTSGSVLFAGSDGVPTQDNANLFYDDSGNVLQTDAVDVGDVNLRQTESSVLDLTGDVIRITRAAAGNTTLLTRVTGDSGHRFVVQADGKILWGPGNAAEDTNLFRDAASRLATDDKFIQGATRPSSYSGRGIVSEEDILSRAGQSNNTEIGAVGPGSESGIRFGSAADTFDTNLYRSAANTLKTDDSFHTASNIVFTTNDGVLIARSYTGAATSLVSRRSTDTFDRFNLWEDGRMEWGPGNAAIDTNLYRAAANTLATNDRFCPADDSLTAQTACGLFAGSGAPSNSNGTNGDFFFSSDRGGGFWLYVKAGGTWSGLL